MSNAIATPTFSDAAYRYGSYEMPVPTPTPLPAPAPTPTPMAGAAIADADGQGGFMDSLIDGVAGFFGGAVKGIGNAVESAWDAIEGGGEMALDLAVNNPAMQRLLDPIAEGLAAPQRLYNGVERLLGGGEKVPDGAFLGPQYPPAGTPRLGNYTQAYYINGIANDAAANAASAQALAGKIGMPVTGIYNATEGFLPDLAECLDLKQGQTGNPAVETTKRALRAAAESGQPTLFVAHSEGGLIFQEALTELKRDPSFQASLDNITVMTAGSAAVQYPDGPRYAHLVNRHDQVPTATGMGPLELLGELRGGQGATLDYFEGPELVNGGHDFAGTYLEEAMRSPEIVDFLNQGGR